MSYLLLLKDSTRVDTIARFRNSGVEVTLTNGWRFLAPTQTGSSGVVATYRDSVVALVDVPAGSVRWLTVTPSGLRDERSAKLPVTAQPLTDRDRRELRDELLKSRAVTSDVAAQRARVASISELPASRSPVWTARFGEDGSLWVGLEDKDNKRTDWLVYPRAGAAFSVRFPAGFDLGSSRGTTVVGRTITKDGLPAIAVYRIPDR
jgi:hypothetical protein